ncbi:MAG: hexokinase [Treponema sp.]|nr:hexokinase [Treponema sp.]
MNEVLNKFLALHGFYSDLNLQNLTQDILKDMDNRFRGKKSYQDMIPTFINPCKIKISEKSAIVIDAGGTNFRSSLVTFSKDGKATLSDFQKTKMPGIEKELSKKEFFQQIAANIERFKDKCSKICFCFSYAMDITEDHDGILINFAKEVKAPEVVGSCIGAELKKALKEEGWTTNPDVILLNDTVSALLAGTGKKDYSSYIGFILGTGLNSAYIQPANRDYELEEQIIVCESAKFGGFKNSDFDILLDEKSVSPGSGPFEKLVSGAYLGPLALEILQVGAKENVFSKRFSEKICKRKSLSLIEVSTYLEDSKPESGTYSDLFAEESPSTEDKEKLFQIFDLLVNRMAQISAVILAADLIQCGQGKDKERPVCLCCNGSSFFKTYKVLERTKKYLEELMKDKDIHYEMLPEEVDITLGSAMAAFI